MFAHDKPFCQVYSLWVRLRKYALYFIGLEGFKREKKFYRNGSRSWYWNGKMLVYTHTHSHTHTLTHTLTHSHTHTLTHTHTHHTTHTHTQTQKKVSKNFVTTFGLPNIHFLPWRTTIVTNMTKTERFFNSQVAPLKRYSNFIRHFYTKHL